MRDDNVLSIPGIRRIPHNTDAEAALLGAILVNNRAYERVCEFLRPEHFAVLDYGAVYASAAALISGGGVADPITLRRDARIAGLDLMALAECAVSVVDAAHYGRLIHELARRRQIIAIGEGIVDRAYNAEIEDLSSAQIEAAVAGLETVGRPDALPILAASQSLADHIPPREWLLGTMMCRGFISLLTGAGGAGKTAWAVTAAIALATGRDLIGMHIHHRSRVILISGEDPQVEIDRRIRACCLRYNIDASALGNDLLVSIISGTGQTLMERINGDLVVSALVGRIIAACKAHQADAIIIDPLVKVAGVEENNNDEMDRVLTLLSRIAARAGVAILILHHHGKSSAAPGDVNAVRGASSLAWGARSARTVYPMSADEAAVHGISDEDRRGYIRVDDAKANLAPMGGAQWYRLIGIELGNATPEYPNGDTVQTVEMWTPPDTFSGVSNDVARTILMEIAAGMPDGERYSMGSAAGDRAAWRCVVRHSPGMTPQRARKILGTWEANGVLLRTRYHSQAQRKEREGLDVDAGKMPS